MLPDFSQPAFAFVALATLRFRAIKDGGRTGPYKSDYRCQFYYMVDPREAVDVEVRVYFVGREEVYPDEDLPVLLAFLDWEHQRKNCREGCSFELREGLRITATGVVHAIAIRRNEI